MEDKQKQADRPRTGILYRLRIGPLGKFFLVVAAIILVALGFAFSVFLLVAAAVIGVLLLGFLWWNARGVRRSRPRE